MRSGQLCRHKDCAYLRMSAQIECTCRHPKELHSPTGRHGCTRCRCHVFYPRLVEREKLRRERRGDEPVVPTLEGYERALLAGGEWMSVTQLAVAMDPEPKWALVWALGNFIEKGGA